MSKRKSYLANKYCPKGYSCPIPYTVKDIEIAKLYCKRCFAKQEYELAKEEYDKAKARFEYAMGELRFTTSHLWHKTHE